MKKFIIIVLCVALLAVGADAAIYRFGLYIDLHPDAPVESFVKTQGKSILLDNGSGYSEFVIRGVNLGSGEPGEWATDYDIDKESYKRWFGYIKEMGANTIRVYTIQNDTFYNAFYEYNESNPDPLYMLHGVWVNDYVQNSRRDAYDSDFFEAFRRDCTTMIDVIHGRKKLSLGRAASAGHGSYMKDVSQWVIGYILGVEWEDITVAYTDEKYKDNAEYASFAGEYLYTTEDATPFEAMLCRVGDNMISYESKRYKTQKLVAFSNWPTTDPFEYPEAVTNLYMKCAFVDTEHIKTTEKLITGQFASYHVYPYYPDYLHWTNDWSFCGITDKTVFYDNGTLNTYRAYLSMLTAHHTMPVVISEFGISTGRGMAHRDLNTNRNQGNMSEREQGKALIYCYNDIMAAGCAGGCVFSWQDEWFKRTWNTMHAVNLTRNPYWSDYQTNEQYFGLLSFDPGDTESVCYVDGDISEWAGAEPVVQSGDMSVCMKYDEKFVYFLVYKKGLDFENESLYIPIDTTPKTGSNYCENHNLKFDKAVDFVLVINGSENSRLLVQERYEVLRSTYSQSLKGFDTYLKDNIPDKNSSKFVNIDMILEIFDMRYDKGASGLYDFGDPSFETGLLRYGNANPDSADFDSLADFMCSGDYVELKLPWQLLNFSDPSECEILDDYYDGNYGIKFINIDSMNVGITSGTAERCTLAAYPLKGWGNRVTYHERLKSSYYMLRDYWNGGAGS